MPSWTNKDERQYEHIKEGYEKKGVSEDKAQEIAARTVNKERREEGRTPQYPHRGRRESTNQAGDSRDRDELENRAEELGVTGIRERSKEERVLDSRLSATGSEDRDNQRTMCIAMVGASRIVSWASARVALSTHMVTGRPSKSPSTRQHSTAVPSRCRMLSVPATTALSVTTESWNAR